MPAPSWTTCGGMVPAHALDIRRHCARRCSGTGRSCMVRLIRPQAIHAYVWGLVDCQPGWSTGRARWAERGGALFVRAFIVLCVCLIDISHI